MSGHHFIIPECKLEDWEGFLDSEDHDLGDIPLYAESFENPLAKIRFKKEWLISGGIFDEQ